jgi:hypothetical protein
MLNHCDESFYLKKHFQFRNSKQWTANNFSDRIKIVLRASLVFFKLWKTLEVREPFVEVAVVAQVANNLLKSMKIELSSLY